MKNVILSLLLLGSMASAHAQVKFDALSFTPEFPKKGEKVSFQFNANASPLTSEEKVEVVIYLFGNGIKAVEPTITQKGKIYSGTLQLDSTTNCIAFGFSANENKDNNSGKGFLVPVYDADNKPVKEYYGAAAAINMGFGERPFGMKSDPEKGLEYWNEALKLHPELKDDGTLYGGYLYSIYAAKKKESQPIILEKLKEIESKKELSEADYSNLVQWYSQFKMKSAADSFSTILKTKYPEGTWKKSELINKMYSEQDADKKKALLNEYTSSYPPQDADKQMVGMLKGQVASAYAAAKNYTAFKEYSSFLPPAAKYSTYNDLAWSMAEADNNIQMAKEMSKEATLWSKKEMLTPTEKKPENITIKQWEQQRKMNYAMYGDTYAFILYKTGDFKTGLPVAKEAATINKLKDAEYNERYALLAEKALPAPAAKKLLEQFVQEGTATPKTKAALKNLYVTEKKSETGYDTYLAALESAAKAKRKAEVAKSMINEPAPQFSLKDFEGKSVSLASLKGNVVVVDFWATWCGPCIASMPGMKMAEEKLKARGDVKFLFVDTWENVENKKENAMEFMKKKNYPFYVLMDDESKVVADFNVSGIPTKFVIDKKGNIRFKAVGFSGNADDLVDEVSTMVEIAAAN